MSFEERKRNQVRYQDMSYNIIHQDKSRYIHQDTSRYIKIHLDTSRYIKSALRIHTFKKASYTARLWIKAHDLKELLSVSGVEWWKPSGTGEGMRRAPHVQQINTLRMPPCEHLIHECTQRVPGKNVSGGIEMTTLH